MADDTTGTGSSRSALAWALGAGLRRSTGLLGGSARLLGRSLLPLLRTVLGGLALFAVLAVPLWIWINVAIPIVDLHDVAELTTADLVQIVVLLALPALAVLAAVALATFAAATIVLDDVAAGRRPRVLRSLGAGVRSAPRLLVASVPAVVVVMALLVAAPEVVVIGLLLVPVTAIGRRVRPAGRWPSWRTVGTMIVPFGAAAAVAARWSAVPAAAVLERSGPRASYARSREITESRRADVAVAIVLVAIVLAATLAVAHLVLGAAGASSTTGDLARIVIEGVVVLLLAAVVVRVFVDGGGEAQPLPDPMPPRVGVAAVVVVALVAGLVPMIVGVRPASAVAPGATIVVDDLGDDADATPGDATCATAAGTCTLRAALDEANAATDRTIGFGVSGTITVASELVLAAPVTIDGADQQVTVSGGGTSAVFRIQMEVPGGGYGAIRNLTIADGTEGSLGGGAVFNNGASAGFTLDRVTVRDNDTPSGALFGGAVLNTSKLDIVNSTFAGNTAAVDGADVANVFSGDLSIRHSTFVGAAGPSAVASSGSAADVTNSIVSGGSFACSGTFTGSGNVTTDASAICPGATAPPAALALQPLADNGGDTATARIAPASVAVDAGDPVACLAIDQRGVARPKGATCDAGAFEVDRATTTALTSSPNPSVTGETVVLRATVTGAEPDEPTGTVQFRDGATVIGTTSLAAGSGGQTAWETSTLPAGTHPLTAVYVPDGGYSTSTSTEVDQVVDAAATTVTLTSTGSPTVGGEAVTFTIDVSGPGAVPTGSVTLLDGSTTIATPTLDLAGTATHTTTTLTGGHHVLTAAYAGDAGHTGATSDPLVHDVVTASTTTLTGPAAPTVYGNDATFDVQVTPSPGGVTPTGVVTLFDGGDELGSGTLDGDGATSIAASGLDPGTHTVTAAYLGDGANDDSTSSPVDHVVVAASTATALDVSPAGSSVYGTTLTLQATVTAPGSAAVPAGAVHVRHGSTTIGSATVDPTGVATMTIASLVPAAYDLQVDFSPATGFLSSSSAVLAHTVTAATTTASMTASSTSSVFGESVTLDARVTSSDSPRTPAGTVTFRDGTTVLGVVALDGSGAASLATTGIAVGSRSLTVQYDGDGNFATSTSAALAHTVTAASVTVTLTDTPDPSVFGGTVALGVTVMPVAPGRGTPTGSVAIREGATVLATVALDGSGHGSTTVGGLPVGAHTLVADYAGDGSFAAGTTTSDHTVAADTATVDLSSSSPSSTFTEPVTFTATVTGTGAAIPTGTVTFRDGGTVLGTATLDGSGTAQLVVPNLRFGAYLVTADYGGDTGFGTATDSIVQVVNAAATAVTLTVDPQTPTVDDVVTLTATVTGSGTSVVPSGTVTFSDDGVVLATVTLDEHGQATHRQTFGRSVHPLTARFTGTPGWTSTTSNTVTITPARATPALSLSGAPNPIGVGGSVTWTATLDLSPDGPTPTGSVRFWSGSTALGPGSIVNGVATLTVPAPSTLGAWEVFATYDGDLNHEQAVSPTASVVVTAAGTSTVSLVPASAYVSDDVVLAAQVSSPFPGTPVAGQVRFTNDSPGSSPIVGAVDGRGHAQVLVSDLPAGTWTVTATFVPAAGSPFGASSGAAPIVVQRRAASVELGAPPAITVGVPFDLPFAVTDLTHTGPTPTGTVTVSGGGASCSVPASRGTCSLVLTTSGPVQLTAAYSGDDRYEPDVSGPVVVVPRSAVSTLTAWSPTATWATGDPIQVIWRLAGPRTGEVVVRTPLGEACRSTVLDLGSCTVTFPFDLRGQSIPIDVAYAGDGSWSPASATLTGTLVGCYSLTFDVVPEGAGTIGAPAGNCNGGAGTLGGTRVGVAVDPVPPYVIDHWLEDGSTSRARSFVVGDGSTSSTALMTSDCVEVSVAAVEQVDLGPARSRGGSVGLTPSNCPGSTTVDGGTPSATATGSYTPGTEVTVTGTPVRPDTDELKGWYVDSVLTRTSSAYTFAATEDVDIDARFGVQCVSPTFTSLGGGSVQPFTSHNCIDSSGGWSWQKGSRVGAHVVPEPYHWIAGYGSTPPAQELVTPYQWTEPDSLVDQANAFWDVTTDLAVEVSFETCRELTLDAQGPGRIEPVTAPDCPTRPATSGTWYRPTTAVDLKAVPDEPHNRPYRYEADDGTVYEGYATVIPTFKDWTGVDETWSLPAPPGPDEPRSRVAMTDSRTVTAGFYDEGGCAPLDVSSVPEGVADLSVDLKLDDGSCPEGQYAQFTDHIGDLATFHAADVQATSALVGWHVSTASGEQHVDHLVENDTPDVPIEGATFATAYVCRAIEPQVTLIAPDGTEQSGLTPPDSSFVSADVDGDCPLWDNAYSIGSTIRIAAMAPPEGYEFLHWDGDVGGGGNPVLEIKMLPEGTIAVRSFTFEEAERGADKPWGYTGAGQKVVIKAVYQVICTRLTITPQWVGTLSVGPEGNCPGADPDPQPLGSYIDNNGTIIEGRSFRFIGGTPVLLDAHHRDGYNTVPWVVVPDSGTDPLRLLNREQTVEAFHAQGLDDLADMVQSMDAPAMINLDEDAVLSTPYRERSLPQRIGDDLAVAGKKMIGFMANFAVGAFETATGLVYGRALLSLASLIANAVDPDSQAAAYLHDAQESLDVLEMGFICAKEWSKGAERPDPPPNPFATTTAPDAPEPDLTRAEVDLRRSLVTTRKAAKAAVDVAITSQVNKLGYKGGDVVAKKLKYLGFAKTFNKGLGQVAAIGTDLYFSMQSGPGARLDDTAQEAWEQGGEVFTDCLYRQIAEASGGHLPLDPDGST